MKLKLSLVVLLAVTMGTMLLSGCNNDNASNSSSGMSTNSMAPSTNSMAH